VGPACRQAGFRLFKSLPTGRQAPGGTYNKTGRTVLFCYMWPHGIELNLVEKHAKEQKQEKRKIQGNNSAYDGVEPADIF